MYHISSSLITRTATRVYYSYESQKISLNFSVIADSSSSKLLYLPFEKLRDYIECSFFEPDLCKLRVRFFTKIQDWIVKFKRIQERILSFFIKQINPRSLGSWCIKGTEESTLEMDSSVPLTHQDLRDLGLIC